MLNEIAEGTSVTTPPPKASLFDERDQPAISATVKLITDADVLAEKRGLPVIPVEEVIVAQEAKLYAVPDHLNKTAPDLVEELAFLLSELRDLNNRFAGKNTNEVQSYLSLTGEHESLELAFYQWCRTYFTRRGDLDRLNPRCNNDPWELFWQCVTEFDGFIGSLNETEHTLHMSVLSLSVSYIQNSLADMMLYGDVVRLLERKPHRFGSKENAAHAHNAVGKYRQREDNFSDFLLTVGKNLPKEYSPTDAPDWEATVRRRIKLRAEEVGQLRFAQGAFRPDLSTPHQLAPGLWARAEWDVFQGSCVVILFTAHEENGFEPASTKHSVSLRRDGLLCCRECPWVYANPDVFPDRLARFRKDFLAVNHFVLETLTHPVFKAWAELDYDLVLDRGVAASATEDEKIEAIAVAMAIAEEEPSDEVEAAEVVAPPAMETEITRGEKGYRIGVFRVMKFARLLQKHFGCSWSSAQGSEVKVIREGGRYCIVRHHGHGDTMWHGKVRDCLDALNIPHADFIAVCRKQHKK